MSYQSTIDAHSPFRYYGLREASGTSADDRGSDAQDGTYEGAFTLGVTGANYGSTAVRFASGTGRVDIGSTTITGRTALTFLKWVRMTSASDYQMIFSSYTSDDDRFEIHTGATGDGNQLGVFVAYGGGSSDNSLISGACFTLNQWHLLAVVYDGSLTGNARIKAYVDAAAVTLSAHAGQVATPPATLSMTTATTYIGSRGGSLSWNGDMQDYALIPAALSGAQITAAYAARDTAPAPTLSAKSIPADGSCIDLTFSESVTGVSAAGWSVLVDGVFKGVASASGSGTAWKLEFGTRWVTAGQTVTLAYDSTTGGVQNGGGGLLATFSASAVTNSSAVIPSAVQLMGNRVVMVVHWGLNTFLDLEWSDGTEDKNDFSPTSGGPDFEQWMKTAQLLGAESVLWTVKHHDGFCAWPTQTTTYGLKDTTWGAANPTRDLVREFVNAARKYGIRPQLYFSIWDRNFEAGGSVGGYDAWVSAQLRELLTNYGPIDAIWSDGWGWEVGYVDCTYATIAALVKQLQPGCALVENNHETDLSNTDVISYESFYDGLPPSTNRLPAFFVQTVLGTPSPSNPIAVAGEWWFWKTAGTTGFNAPPVASGFITNRDTVLARRSVFALNVAPDTAGLIPDDQVQRCAEIGAGFTRATNARIYSGAGVNGSPILGML